MCDCFQFLKTLYGEICAKHYEALSTERTETPGVGEHSFSTALIEELLKRADEPLNTSQLHYRIVTRLRTWAPDRYEEQREHPVLGVMGEGGRRNDSIRLVFYRKHSVNLIALWQKFARQLNLWQRGC